MGERIEKDELARRLAERMNSDPTTAAAWIDGLVETLYASFKKENSSGGFQSRYAKTATTRASERERV